MFAITSALQVWSINKYTNPWNLLLKRMVIELQIVFKITLISRLYLVHVLTVHCTVLNLDYTIYYIGNKYHQGLTSHHVRNFAQFLPPFAHKLGPVICRCGCWSVTFADVAAGLSHLLMWLLVRPICRCVLCWAVTCAQAHFFLAPC